MYTDSPAYIVSTATDIVRHPETGRPVIFTHNDAAHAYGRTYVGAGYTVERTNY